MQLTSSDSLVLALASAHATTPLDWVVSTADTETTTFGLAALTPSNGQSNGTTEVTIASAPSAGRVRKVAHIIITNRDTIAHTVRVAHANGATRRRLCSYLVGVDQVLEWLPETGWRVTDIYGRENGSIVLPAPTLRRAEGFLAGALTAVRTITSTNTMAVYLGKAERAYSSISLRYRVTTAAATITWAEVAIARGTPVLAGNPSLTRLGFTDVSGVVNTTGQKTTAIALTGCASGDDLWALIGNQATTAMIVRGGLADDLQAGFAAAVVTRPSTMGASTAFTLDGATAVMPWVAWLPT